MRSQAEFVAFEQALQEIAAAPLPEYLPSLYLALDDDCDQHEVMFGLVHFLEAFIAQEQLEAFVQILPQLVTQAPDWSRIYITRILNNDTTRILFKSILASASQQAWNDAKKIFMYIAANKNPPLSQRAASVLVP